MSAHLSEDRNLIRSALLELRTVTDFPMAFGGPVLADRHLRLDELVGARTSSLRGLTVRTGTGLGGKVVAVEHPVSVSDYRNAEVITHEYDRAVEAEGLQSLIAFPVIVRRQVRAVLYSGMRRTTPVGGRLLCKGADIARELEQELAVRDEVERRLAHVRGERREDTRPAPEREHIREVYAQLRIIAQQTDDSDVRARVRDVVDHLDAGGKEAGARTAVRLAPRELDVLSCIAIGCSNAEAASRLGLLPETVKSYLRSVMSKLHCHNRTEAVRAARRAGLLP
jgi:DNA-binding CsgD family transcriptional regulator